jgi:hypothetical protein
MSNIATATMTLSSAWLMDPLDPTNAIVAGTTGAIGGGARANTRTLDGEFRFYVGRVRMVVRKTKSKQMQIALRNLTKDQADHVEEVMTGQLLLLRDFYGRKVWGGFLETNRVEYIGGGGLCDVQFTFTEVTHSEAV